MSAATLVDKPGTESERKARGEALFNPIRLAIDEAIAADVAEGRAPRIGRPVDWPEVMARIARGDREARHRAFAIRRESEPAEAWKARLCPMVGGSCVTARCVCWVGTDDLGFCAQIAVMRRQIETRSASCS